MTDPALTRDLNFLLKWLWRNARCGTNKESKKVDCTEEETNFLRSHFATSRRGGRRHLPYVFTQEGVAMLSGVLNSERAIMVNIQIMRAFAQFRHLLLTHKDLRRKIEEMEKKYDAQFKVVFDALKKLLEPSPAEKRRIIGFRTYDKEKKD